MRLFFSCEGMQGTKNIGNKNNPSPPMAELPLHKGTSVTRLMQKKKTTESPPWFLLR